MDLAMAWVELRWSKRLLSVVEGIAGLKNSPSSELTFFGVVETSCFITWLLFYHLTASAFDPLLETSSVLPV